MDSCFVQDIYPNNALYAVTIRSPVAKGRLKSIDCPILPDNYFFIKASDIPGKNQIEGTDLPILTGDNLSYIGEPMALLLGPDKTWLEEYSMQCRITLEEEEPLISFLEAPEEMVLARRDIKIGDPEEAYSRAIKTIQSEYWTGMQEHCYPEPVGAVSWYEDGLLVVKTATQWPKHVERSIAGVLDIAPSSLSVRPTLLDPDMDNKLWYPSLIACHASLGTFITKNPVRLILNREEEFLFSPKRPETLISISSALDDNGNIIGTEIDASVNLGAFGVNTEEFLDQIFIGSLGMYNFGSIKFYAKAIRTNIPPAGSFSGFGLSQGFFAHERHVCEIVEEIKQDPVEWRKSHINKTGNIGFNPKNGEELISAAASMADYYRKWASYELIKKNRTRFTWSENSEGFRGIGIALGCQENGKLKASSFPKPGCAASVVEITIDPIEYIPKIRGVWLCIDGGKILNENHARTVLNITAAQAIGWSFEEEIHYSQGMLSHDDFENYTIPVPGDIPPICIDFLNSDSEESKGIGDLPFNCIPAAFLQAVSQAMDRHFCSIPIKRSEILEAKQLVKTEKTV